MNRQVYISQNAFNLQLTVTDPLNNPIANAVVNVTLFAGRSRLQPNVYPGTPVPPIVSLNLPQINAQIGLYGGNVNNMLNPLPTSSGYTLVADGAVAGISVYHQEIPATVLPYAVDLTTALDVAGEIGIVNVTAQTYGILQDYVTAFSLAVIAETGIKSFSQPVQMNERRNGNGNAQMFVAMPPVINVSAVTVSGVSIPLAGAWPSWGYYVADDGKSIYIVQAGSPTAFNWYPKYQQPPTPGFSRGIGNVSLQYWGGYINVPPDLEMAARKMCAIYYGRKQTRDLQSQAETTAGAAATTRYRDWKVPPELDCIVKYYRKTAFV